MPAACCSRPWTTCWCKLPAGHHRPALLPLYSCKALGSTGSLPQMPRTRIARPKVSLAASCLPCLPNLARRLTTNQQSVNAYQTLVWCCPVWPGPIVSLLYLAFTSVCYPGSVLLPGCSAKQAGPCLAQVRACAWCRQAQAEQAAQGAAGAPGCLQPGGAAQPVAGQQPSSRPGKHYPSATAEGRPETALSVPLMAGGAVTWQDRMHLCSEAGHGGAYLMLGGLWRWLGCSQGQGPPGSTAQSQHCLCMCVCLQMIGFLPGLQPQEVMNQRRPVTAVQERCLSCTS